MRNKSLFEFNDEVVVVLIDIVQLLRNGFRFLSLKIIGSEFLDGVGDGLMIMLRFIEYRFCYEIGDLEVIVVENVVDWVVELVGIDFLIVFGFVYDFIVNNFFYILGKGVGLILYVILINSVGSKKVVVEVLKKIGDIFLVLLGRVVGLKVVK